MLWLDKYNNQNDDNDNVNMVANGVVLVNDDKNWQHNYDNNCDNDSDADDDDGQKMDG